MATNQLIRVASGVGTIPLATALSGGVATTDANNSHALLYTGTDVLDETAFPITHCGVEGSAWVYSASGTPQLARVMAIVPVDLTNPAALVYSIILDRAMTGLSSDSISYINADLKKYSIANQGDADGEFDGVVLGAGVTVAQQIEWDLGVNWMEAKTYDATGTSFLVTENK